MQRIEELVEALRGGIRKEVRDHSLLAELNKELQQTPLDSTISTSFTRIVFVLYDLSNHHSLIKRDGKTAGGVYHDEMALAMKLTVFKMLSSLVVFYSDTPSAQLPLPLLRESLQIMVLVARLFIDLGQSTEVKSLYPLVSSFFQAATGISLETQMLHHLNCLQLMRMDVDRGLLDSHDFRREMQAFLDSSRNVANSNSYRELAEYITLEVTLKLIKSGNVEKAKPIRNLLPEKLAQVLAQVINFQNRLLQNDLPQLKVSPFYELFLSLKNTPQQVSQERLRTFISQGENFRDPRIFDVVALTGCLLPFEIWLETYINTRQRCDNISCGYKCYIFVVDKFFSSPNPNPNTSDITARHQQTITQLESYQKLSQLIMLALLLEKKETQEPVVGVLKRVLRVMAHSVIGLYPKSKQMKQFGQKAGLLCGKFGLGQLGKSISCILFYYQILMGIASQESYSRFYKSNLMEKSSAIFKTIKLAYEIRSGKAALSPQDVEWVKREPYLAVLFQKQLKESIVLAIPPEQFSKAQQKFQIYFMLSANLSNAAEGDVVRLAQHMEETLIRAELGKISRLELKYIGMATAHLLKLVEEDSLGAATRGRVGVLLLYLVSISNFSTQLATINSGILLNRYSKLMKLLSIGFQGVKTLAEQERGECIERYLFLAKGVICWSLEELKLLQASSPMSVAAIQPGSLLFYDLLLSFVMTHEKTPQHVEFIRFARFELACLTDTVSDGDLVLERNLKLLRLYCSSRWIRKPIKLKILRRLIKEELITESRQLTLEDLNDLIILTELPHERKMYAEYLLKLFGEQGRTYLMMQAASHPSVYEFLTLDDADQEECHL